jgi:hypothetical protein
MTETRGTVSTAWQTSAAAVVLKRNRVRTLVQLSQLQTLCLAVNYFSVAMRDKKCDDREQQFIVGCAHEESEEWLTLLQVSAAPAAVIAAAAASAAAATSSSQQGASHRCKKAAQRGRERIPKRSV